MTSFTALNGASPKIADPPTLTADKSPAPDEGPSDPPLAKPQSAPLDANPSTSSGQREAWASQNLDRPSLHSADYPKIEHSHKRKRSGSDEPRDSSAHEQHGPSNATATPSTHAEPRDTYSTPQRDYRPYGDDHRNQERDKEPWYPHQSRDDRAPYNESQHNSAVTPTHTTDEQIGDALQRATAGHMDHADYGTTSPDGDDRSMHIYGGAYTPDHRPDSILQHDPKKRKRNFSNRTKTGCLTCRKRKKKCDESKPECSNCIRGGFVCAGYPPQRGPMGWQKPDNKAAAVPLESKDPSYVPPGAYGIPQPQPQPQQAPQQAPPQVPQVAVPPPQPPQPPQAPQSQPQPQPQPQPPVGPSYGPQPVKRESISHYRGQALRIDPPQGRPLVTSEDDRATATTIPSASVTSQDNNNGNGNNNSNSSNSGSNNNNNNSSSSSSSSRNDNNKLSAVPFTPANAFPTPISANTQAAPFGERMVKDYQRVPPLHDLSRTAEPETPHPSTQLPQINILHATRANSPTPRPQPPPPPAISNPQMTAQLALSHAQYPTRRTQKEEMLSGRQFYPFDKELCLERERCATACWRFNNLTAPPATGVSPEERARLFLEILQPRDPVRVSPGEASSITNMGRVGRHVAVETPFVCDYGYNISIGHHVVIGRNCTINDVCEVNIGDNCVIGPNVSIFTASLPMDPKKRQGGQGPQYGKAVTIEQDCFIGGGAIILPGRTVGKGSTVGAGSIVTKDVPPFTIVAGNPARVLRGIAS